MCPPVPSKYPSATWSKKKFKNWYHNVIKHDFYCAHKYLTNPISGAPMDVFARKLQPKWYRYHRARIVLMQLSYLNCGIFKYSCCSIKSLKVKPKSVQSTRPTKAIPACTATCGHCERTYLPQNWFAQLFLIKRRAYRKTEETDDDDQEDEEREKCF